MQRLMIFRRLKEKVELEIVQMLRLLLSQVDSIPNFHQEQVQVLLQEDQMLQEAVKRKVHSMKMGISRMIAKNLVSMKTKATNLIAVVKPFSKPIQAIAKTQMIRILKVQIMFKKKNKRKRTLPTTTVILDPILTSICSNLQSEDMSN